jgi:hypothetical protein
MSGPVVAIGWILLLPSFLGMAFAGVLLTGSFAYISSPATGTQSVQPAKIDGMNPDDPNITTRRICMEQWNASPTALEVNNAPLSGPQMCECALETMQSNDPDVQEALRETMNAHGPGVTDDMRKPLPSAMVLCYFHALAHTLSPLNEATKNLYEQIENPPQPPPQTRVAWLPVLGSFAAAVIGIASFVGGLLGWLLVMRKRVLRCSVCGATVSAS